MATNLPVSGKFNVTAYFGQKGTLWSAGWHKGVDVTASNKNIYSMCDGEVTVVGWDEKGWGRYVSIKPKGFDRVRIILCHLVKNSVKVKKGQSVTRTTVLGTMGTTGNSTGVHTHIEMRIDNTSVDPTPYMKIENKKATGLVSTDYKITEAESDEILQSMIDKFDGKTSLTIEQVAKKVINGEYGNGNEIKKRLAAEGYDYKTVQAKVNELLKPKTTKLTIEQVAKKVIKGEYGNGNERKKRLAAEGYDYKTVQAKVNELLKKR